jgi:hypothetical protein
LLRVLSTLTAEQNEEAKTSAESFIPKGSTNEEPEQKSTYLDTCCDKMCVHIEHVLSDFAAVQQSTGSAVVLVVYKQGLSCAQASECALSSAQAANVYCGRTHISWKYIFGAFLARQFDERLSGANDH